MVRRKVKMKFDLFVGIDWSGAAGPFQRGIQLAAAQPGSSVPQLIAPPDHRGWSRPAVLAWLRRQRAEGHAVLAGIDFAFAHPYRQNAGYFPEAGQTAPCSARELWQLVEQHGHHDETLYGGHLWAVSPWGDFYNAPRRRDGSGGRGRLFASHRRQTEMASVRDEGRSPSSSFNCVGPASVGTGSLAGMRLLHQLGNEAEIWPITSPKNSSALPRFAVVEIFPSLYFHQAGIRDRDKKTDPLAATNHALAHFDAAPISKLTEGLPDHDDLDALVAAAALRALHDPAIIWPLGSVDQELARLEGWIFGVRSNLQENLS